MRRGGLDWSQAALRDDGLPRAGDSCGTGCGSGGRPWRSTLWDGVPQGGEFGPPISAEQLLSRQPRSTLWEGFGEGPPLGPLQSAAEIAAKPARVSIWEGFREGDGRFARELARPRRASAAAPPCGCQDPPVAPRPRPPRQDTGTRSRQVSGDWLAEVLRLDPETAQRIAGQTVALDAEAWGAVQSALSARALARATHARVVRKRERIWPGGQRAAGRPGGPAHLPDDEAGATIARALGGERGGSFWEGGRRAPTWAPTSRETTCDCGPFRARSAGAPRYVDSERGDDTSSGTLEFDFKSDPARITCVVTPWQTLRKVEHWLSTLASEPLGAGRCVEGAEVYLRRGRVWNGSEEKNADGTVRTDSTEFEYLDWSEVGAIILDIRGFHATDAGRLILGAWSSCEGTSFCTEEPGPGTAWPGQRPIIAGTPADAEVQYDDERVGISLRDCCYVAMSELTVHGFGTGIRVRHHSKHHTYTNLHLSDHAEYGMHLGIVQTDVDYVVSPSDHYTTDKDAGTHCDELAARIAELIEGEHYPEYIEIIGCVFSSIGYNTEAADLMIGFLATNFTITGNTLRGDAARGLDGIELVGSSTGHVIDQNTVYGHRKLCRLTERSDDVTQEYKAVFVEAGGTQLWHPCDGEEIGGGDPTTTYSTDYGYEQLYYDFRSYDSSGAKPPYDTYDTLEAFGENGIALKAARRRTDTALPTIEIFDNVVYRNQVFAGITVYEGSQDVYVYQNRVFQNEVGIAVWNTNNDAWYNDGDPTYYQEKTERITIAYNTVYMNEAEGVKVNSQTAEVSRGTDAGGVVSFQVSDVYLFYNTVAHNLYTGVLVTTADAAGAGTAAEDVSALYLIANIIVRNGRGGPDLSGQHQVSWGGAVQVDTTLAYCWADHNCYLGWEIDEDLDRWADVKNGKVILWELGADADTSASLTRERAESEWGIEPNGVQAEDLSELGLACFDALYGSDGTDGIEGERGDDLSTYIPLSTWTAVFLELDYSTIAGSDEFAGDTDGTCCGSAGASILPAPPSARPVERRLSARHGLFFADRGVAR